MKELVCNYRGAGGKWMTESQLSPVNLPGRLYSIENKAFPKQECHSSYPIGLAHVAGAHQAFLAD